MDMPSSKSESKSCAGLIAGLMALAVVFSLLSCLVLIATPSVIDAVALRSLANQFGTKSSKAAVITHVTELLEDHKGSSKMQVHRLLDDIGGFSYLWQFKYGEGESFEEAYWLLAKVPIIGAEIRAVWTLRYDVNDRLTEVKLVAS